MSQRPFPRRAVLRLGALSLASLLMPDTPLQSAETALLTRPIPSTGEPLPAVGLGTWQSFDVAGDPAAVEEARETLRALAAAGGRVLDSSPMYGSAEAVAGQLVQELGLRERVFVATKVWTEGRNAGRAQMDASMKKLRVERLDLMQVHNLVDAGTHLQTLREWKAAGRVRYVGVTHYHAGAHAALETVVRSGEVQFVQVNYSLDEPEAERRLLPAAAASGVAVVVNRPFAEGSMFRRVKGKPLPPLAGELGCASWAQYFLKWILGHPAVTCAIPGTRNPRHLADNLAAARGPIPDAAARKRMAEHFASL
ncbi:MAG TPA: aldo/keto reductase [Burkholderiales bacterium]|nr:aldo/keto reductase [Burkholderiales bacterium]